MRRIFGKAGGKAKDCFPPILFALTHRIIFFRKRVFVLEIVIAMDSFKGSLSSMEAGNAVCSGILRIYPDAKINVLPLADGGEGTVEALTLGMGGELQSLEVTGPINEQKVTAKYGILRDKKTAIIEMAAAAGLTLLPPEKRHPLYTTTYGVGEILRDAIHKGCHQNYPTYLEKTF